MIGYVKWTSRIYMKLVALELREYIFISANPLKLFSDGFLGAYFA